MEKEYLCPSCQKPLIFDENLSCYYCIDCNTYYESSEFESKEENAFAGLYNTLDCKMCGKKLIISQNFKYDICPFCYNNLIDITNGVLNFKPSFIIPFKDTLESFKNSFFEKAKKENVPSNLLANISEDSIKGVYLPFYIYTIENSAKAFFETREVDDGYDDFTKQRVTYVENSDVLVDITQTLSNKQISIMGDYNFKKMDMFFPEKMGEFYTLLPVLNVDTAWNEMKKIVKLGVELEINSMKAKSEVVKDMKVFTSLKNLSRRLVLLPVWMLESHIDDNVYNIYVNGQTDKIASDMEFEPVVKKSFFGKKKFVNNQVRVLERENFKRTLFKTSIEYLNELRKYEINPNDRLANIRKIR